VFDSARAELVAEEGQVPILICPTTSPQDINGMIVAAGIITGRGGRASHAAVVARGMGKPAVCGVEAMSIDHEARRATFTSGVVLSEGDEVTVDGHGGQLLAGAARFANASPDPWMEEFLSWCDERSRLPVLDAAPAGAATVTGPDDEVPLSGPVVVDVAWEGVDSNSSLALTCRNVFQDGSPTTEVYLALPRDLGGIDFRPPAGPWAGVVAPRRDDWASRLLAARLTRPAAEDLGD
jgi:phosphohistidine swiveling domain-containing protein